MTTLAGLRSRCRTRLNDVAQPYLWADSELTELINDALIEVYARGRLWNASSPLGLIDGIAHYDLTEFTPAPFLITTVTLASTPGDFLVRTSQADILRDYGTLDFGSGTPTCFSLDDPFDPAGTLGVTTALSQITFYPTPAAADTATVTYVALPPTLAQDTSSVPLPPHLLMGFLDAIEMLAYRKRDADTYNPQQALLAEQRVVQRLGPLPSARALMEEQMTAYPVVIAE